MLQANPAVLLNDDEPWFHITHQSKLAAIRRNGLDPNPAVRTYGGSLQSLGGVYVTSKRFLELVTAIIKGTHGCGIATLSLRLTAGTRFCLDEDTLTSGLVDPTHSDQRGIPPELAQQALSDPASDPHLYPNRKKRIAGIRTNHDYWSCRLAQALDQRYLKDWLLRVFDPPVILSIDAPRVDERWLRGWCCTCGYMNEPERTTCAMCGERR